MARTRRRRARMTRDLPSLITFRERSAAIFRQLGPKPLTAAETYCNSCRGVRRLEGAKLKAMLRAGRAASQARAGACQSIPEAIDDGMAARRQAFCCWLDSIGLAESGFP